MTKTEIKGIRYNNPVDKIVRFLELEGSGGEFRREKIEFMLEISVTT